MSERNFTFRAKVNLRLLWDAVREFLRRDKRTIPESKPVIPKFTINLESRQVLCIVNWGSMGEQNWFISHPLDRVVPPQFEEAAWEILYSDGFLSDHDHRSPFAKWVDSERAKAKKEGLL